MSTRRESPMIVTGLATMSSASHSFANPNPTSPSAARTRRAFWAGPGRRGAGGTRGGGGPPMGGGGRSPPLRRPPPPKVSPNRSHDQPARGAVERARPPIGGRQHVAGQGDGNPGESHVIILSITRYYQCTLPRRPDASHARPAIVHHGILEAILASHQSTAQVSPRPPKSETPMLELAGWDSFYVITGSSAAALTGLMFVMNELTGEVLATPSTICTIRAFSTPTVDHFWAVL